MAQEDVSQEYLNSQQPLTNEEFERELALQTPEVEVTPEDTPVKPAYIGTEQTVGTEGSTAKPYSSPDVEAPEDTRSLGEQHRVATERGWINGSIEVTNSLKELSNFVTEGLGLGSLEPTPRVPEEVFSQSEGLLGDNLTKPTAVSAQFNESTTQFIQGFLPALKAIKMMQVGTKSLKALNPTTAIAKKVVKGAVGAGTAGVVADFSAFNPYEKRLSNWAKDSGIAGLDNALTEYLASDPNDTALEGRAKQAIEGFIAGKIAEGGVKAIMKTLSTYKRLKTLKLQEAGELPQDKPVAYIVDPATGEKKVIASEVNPATGNLIDPQTKQDIPALERKIPDAEAPVGKLDAETEKAMSNALLDGDLEGFARIQAGFVNLKHIETMDDVKDLIEALANKREEVIGKSSRSWEEASKKAGTDLNTYSAKVAGLDTDVAKATLARNTLAYVTQDLARKAKANPTPENLVSFQQAFGKYNIVSAMVSQNASEIARALRIMALDQGVAKGIDRALRKAGADGASLWDTLKTRADVVNPMTGRTPNDEWMRVANFVADLPDSGAVNKLAQASNQPDWTDAINEVYINSLFTVKTITTNLGATLSSIGTSVGERYIGASKNIGNLDPDSIGFREANRYAVSMLKAIPEAFHVFGKSYTTNSPVFSNANKEFIDEGLGGAMSGNTFGITKDRYPLPTSFKGVGLTEVGNVMMRTLGGAIDLFGALSRALGTKMLMASDEGMKAMVYRAELHGLVERNLRKQGLKPSMVEYELTREAMLKAVADKDTSSAYYGLSVKAMDEAHIKTFTEELGQNGKNITGLIRHIPASHLLVPFIKTPVNLLKYVGRRTPVLAEFSDYVNLERAKGGASAQLIDAQITAGTMAYIAGGTLSAQHMMNGDVSGNWTIGRNNEALGIKARAIVYEDGTQVSMDGFDGTPLSFAFLSATVRETIDEYIEHNKNDLPDEELNKAVLEMSMIPIMAYTKYASNSTWMRSVGEAMQVLTDGSNVGFSDYASNTFRDGVSNLMIPNSVRWATETFDMNGAGDPYARNVQTLVESIQAKLPSYNKEVPPRPDLLGDPTPTRKYLMNSIRISKAEQPTDPLRAELKRLQEVTPNEMVMGGAIRTVGSGKDAIKLTNDEQWNVMQFMSKIKMNEGKNLAETLTEIINDEDYKNATDFTKEATLTLAYNKFKEGAVDILIQDQMLAFQGKPRGNYVNKLKLYPYKRKTPIMERQAMKTATLTEKKAGDFGEKGITRGSFIDELVNQGTTDDLNEQLDY